MATIKKQPRKLVPVKKAQTELKKADDTFEIEENPPVPIRGLNEEKIALYKKLDNTVGQVKEGGAFIIDSRLRHTIERHLKVTYEGKRRFMFSKIIDNPEKLRVYVRKPQK